ncbi:hypothetical protein [Caldanaerobacter subterraneus]|uniref:Uncharacterized protein n=1 Tax=Caldanaerobacter subterraneus TaxID=911092 RepID=A0A7Y2L8J8_9THEO|nr:hypothetical protein [Caldanaerobacter subterraneus]NNG66391.1 hypothetical protein [Caldanaerobacter subterraneus]
MRRIIFSLTVILGLFLNFSFVYANTPQIFYDTYTDYTYIDTSKTTANVDTKKVTDLPSGQDIGAVNLPFYIYPGVLKVRENKDIVVVNGNSVSTFSFDGSKMVENTLLKIDINNPLALTLLNSYDISVLTSNGITTYSFDGSKMVQNPLLSISGLINPINISSLSDKSISVLDKQGNVANYSFDGSQMIQNPILSKTGISNPLELAADFNSYDFAVLQGNSVIYYSFDGTQMTQNPFLSIAGLTKPVAFDVTNNGKDIVVIDENNVKYFQFDGSGMIQNSILSFTGLNKPVAISFEPNTTSYAVLDQQSDSTYKVRYFQFDGTKMVENPLLEVSGLQVNSKFYESGKILYSIPVTLTKDVNNVIVNYESSTPTNTAINIEVSLDGGITWTSVSNGVPTPVTQGNILLYRAILTTNDGLDTPELYWISILDNTLRLFNFTITDIVNPPVQQTLPTSTFPVYIKAGYNFSFSIETTGNAESVKADFYDGKTNTWVGSTTLSKIGDEIWTGTYHTPVDLIDTTLSVVFTAYRGGETAQVRYDNFAIIQGSALGDLIIQRTN